MTFDPRTHELVARVVQPDGSYIDEIRERETPLELENHHVYYNAKWDEVRRVRDRLLAESDWVIVRAAETGFPVPAEWLAYRKALRDITYSENPFFLTWPEKPAVTSAPTFDDMTDVPEVVQITWGGSQE